MKKIAVNDRLYNIRWVVIGKRGIRKMVINTITRRDVLPAVGEYFFVNIFSILYPLCLNIAVPLGEITYLRQNKYNYDFNLNQQSILYQHLSDRKILSFQLLHFSAHFNFHQLFDLKY